MFRRIITASFLKLVTKISIATLTQLKIPFAGLGVALLAMGLPVFPAAAVKVTMTLSDGDTITGADAQWTATVCYDTANVIEHIVSPLFIRYFPAKMTFILERNDDNSRIGAGGTIRAYPVETHTHYMLGVHSNGRRRHTLDVVGVGDNRIGTERSSMRKYVSFSSLLMLDLILQSPMRFSKGGMASWTVKMFPM